MERSTGTRVWRVDHITAECPNCGVDNEIGLDALDDEEIWYANPFECECYYCGRTFEVVAEEDDK